jgi:hypothetical protein
MAVMRDVCRTALVMIACMCPWARGAEPSPPPPEQKMLLQKPLDAGGELVIVRGPETDAARFRGILPEEMIGPARAVFSVWAELRAGGDGGEGRAAIVLWSALLPVLKDERAPTVAALDAAIRQGELVVALAWGSAIYLYIQEIGPPGVWGGRTAVLRPADWSLLAAASSILPEQIHVKLDRAKDGRWSAVVIHRVPNGEQRTRFDQVKETWEFRKADRQQTDAK